MKAPPRLHSQTPDGALSKTVAHRHFLFGSYQVTWNKNLLASCEILLRMIYAAVTEAAHSAIEYRMKVALFGEEENVVIVKYI